MKTGSIFSADRGICLVPAVRFAQTAWERGRGLLAFPPLQSGEGLLITACGSVHTLGMRYALDLVYLDRAGRVKKMVYGLKPARFSGALGAVSTLELPAGSLIDLQIALNEKLIWKETVQ